MAANRTSTIWSLVIMAVTCWFIAVVTYRWLMNYFPSSKFVLLMVCGMSVVGAVASFAVSALANAAFRVGPAKLRIAFTAVVWLAVCGAVTKWLLNDGADLDRTLIASAITVVSGLIVGPMNAELVVSRWSYRKRMLSEAAQTPHE
jgi:hypothetical protein